MTLIGKFISSFKKKPVEQNQPVYLAKIDTSGLLPRSEVKINMPEGELRPLLIPPKLGEKYCPDFNIFTEKSADGLITKYNAADSDGDGLIDSAYISVFRMPSQSQEKAHYKCTSADGKQVFESNIVLPSNELLPVYCRTDYTYKTTIYEEKPKQVIVTAGNESYYYANGKTQSNVTWNDTHGDSETRTDYLPNGKKNKNPNLNVDPATQYIEVITYTAKP